MMRVGLISDTHMPQRWKQIPTNVFSLFADVDLIIHAGDVGELWVLGALSSLAPVIAVCGNDEPYEATAALPFLQTIAVSGHRIVVTHSHYPDRDEEMANRRIDDWYPKLQYRADFGKAHGAKIVVTGHTHIPMCIEHDGVLIINAGAIASANEWSRQAIQTVAIMELEPDTEPIVTHYDLATAQPYNLPFDPDLGFIETAQPYLAQIVDDELLAARTWLWQNIAPIAREDLIEHAVEMLHSVLDGDIELITPAYWVEALKADVRKNETILDKLKEHPTFAQYI